MKQITVELKSLSQPIQTVLELYHRNSTLFGVAGLHVGLLVVFVIGIILDPRTVAGDPVWLKPAKFAASIALFTATLGWLGHHLPVPDRTLRRVSLGIAVAALLEITLIGGQAARGIESHFNNITALNTAICLIMGITILAMTILVAWLLIQSWKQAFDVAPAFAWGIRFGIALFVLGALEGGAMVTLGTNSVGSGPALPVLGWVLSGDFRVAHFLGLHALQVLPLVGYVASVGGERNRLQRPVQVVTIVAIGYAVILFIAFTFAFSPVVG